MSFSYVPLDRKNREIRLLQILPHPTAVEGLPACRLRHVSLHGDEIPQFETMSYCWGDPTRSVFIDIDGTSVNVPVSSAKAITRAALPDAERIIWIDAICINQVDLSERAQQVTLMGLVYSSATRNLIYLGEGDESYEPSLEALRTVDLEIVEETRNAGFDDFMSYLGALWRGDVVLSRTHLRRAIDENALLAFYNLPWFSRVWVVQEVVLAAENVCLYGNQEVDFVTVMQVAAWISKHSGYNIADGFQTSSGMINSSAMYEQRARKAFTGRIRFEDALAITSLLQVTDPRDKVFGVLGLCFDDNDQIPIPGILAVDYQKPLGHVFRDATKHIIVSTDKQVEATGLGGFVLRWISHRCDDDLLDESFPSWVPRLERQGDPVLDDMTLFVHGTQPVLVDNVAVFDIDNDNALLLRGSKLDVVSETSPVLAPGLLKDHDDL